MDKKRLIHTLSKGVGVFSPISLGASALAWWSADYAASLALNSNKVITWTDRIAGIAPTQGTDANRPVYSATSFGGYPGLTFDGAATYLTIASQPLPSGASPCEIWGVVQQDGLVADATTRRFFAYGGTSNNDTRQATRFVTGGANRANATIGTGAASSSPTTPAVDFSGKHVVRIVIDGTTANVYVDGYPGTQASIVPSTGTTRVTIGAVLAAAGYWNGKIRDIVVTGLLTEQQSMSMWAWGLDQSTIGSSAMTSWIALNGDSYSTTQGGDGMGLRLRSAGRIVTMNGVGGNTLAQQSVDVVSRTWHRNGILIFWDGNSNGYGTLADDMALYAQVAATVPKTIIIPPVRRGVDNAGTLAAESALQAAIATAYSGRTIDAQAVLAAAATSPGDDADVSANVVPRSLLIDHVSNAHLNSAGWDAIMPAVTTLLSNLGW